VSSQPSNGGIVRGVAFLLHLHFKPRTTIFLALSTYKVSRRRRRLAMKMAWYKQKVAMDINTQ